MESDMALSKMIQKKLYGIFTQKRIDFIKAISQAVLANKLVEKKSLISFFSKARYIFTLASNSSKTFFQVGGNFVFVILVLSFNTYAGATYVGVLSENDQNLITIFQSLYKQHEIEFKFNNLTDCSCLLDNVYCIFDTTRIRGSIESYIECSEVYLSKELTAKFTKISIIRYIYLNKKCFLMSLISLEEIPYFNYFQQLSSMEVSSCTLSEHIIDTFETTNLEVSEASTIINQLHLDFLNKNKIGIIQGFCELVALMTNLSIKNDTERQLEAFSMILSKEFFPWCVYLILFRTQFSSLPLTLLYECILDPCFTPLQIFIDYVHVLHEKNVDDLKQVTIDSLKSVGKNYGQELNCVLNLLDAKNQTLEEEINVVSELFPTFVLVHRYQHDFAGKTLLGGLISISQNCIYQKSTEISNAALILTLRHEICHKKWLFEGSSHIFSCRTPPYGSDDFQEAGILLDRVALGHFDHNKIFDMVGINETIAEKIRSGIQLDSAEIDSIFVLAKTARSSKNMGQGKKHYQYICTGRPSSGLYTKPSNK